MPTYPKSKTWRATAKRVEKIIKARSIKFKVFADECGLDYFATYRVIKDNRQPSPEVEAKVEAWCEKHSPKTT